MPYMFDWKSARAVHVRFIGVVTDHDLISATNDFYNDKRVDLVREVTWDFLNIDDFVIDPAYVSEIAASDAAASSYMQPIKSAFVIQLPALVELAIGYIADMEAFGSPWLNRIFDNLEEAEMWLSA